MTDVENPRANSGTAAQIRKYYESLKAPFTSSARARRDVLSLLEERKAIVRAAERLVQAATPYAGDPAVKEGVDAFRALLEDRPRA